MRNKILSFDELLNIYICMHKKYINIFFLANLYISFNLDDIGFISRNLA